jgi:hypothetical protein
MRVGVVRSDDPKVENQSLRAVLGIRDFDIVLREFKESRLQAEIHELEPKAKVGDKVIGGGRTRGQENATAQGVLRKQWTEDLRAHYRENPLTPCRVVRSRPAAPP